MQQAGCCVAVLLFFPGSRPLHNQLLSILHTLPSTAAVHHLILDWVCTLAAANRPMGQQHVITGALPEDVPAYLTVSLPNGARCPIASTVSSLASIPMLKDTIAEKTIQLLHPLTRWLQSTVNASAVNAERQEQCQDVVKVLLVLLQSARRTCGISLANKDVCVLVDVAIDALKSDMLPRECLTMLGSLLWEAWGLPINTPASGAALLGSILSSGGGDGEAGTYHPSHPML